MTVELGLVLSGGGAPAAYFGVGVALALEEAGLRPGLYSGVSAGSLNAAALAAGIPPADLAEVWRGTTTGQVVRPRLDVWNLFEPLSVLRRPGPPLDMLLGSIGWTWTLSTAPARALLTEILGGESVDVAEDITLVVSAVDQGSAEVVRFVNRLPPAHRGSENPEFVQCALSIDHVLASAAAPILFQAGRVPELPGRELVDAGLVANTPLKPALAYEPDAVVVVSASGINRPAPPPNSLGAAIGLLAENVAHFAMLADYKHARTVNDLVAAAPETPRKHVTLLLIEPHDVAFSAPAFLRFDREDANRVIDLGLRQGREALDGWSSLNRPSTTNGQAV